MPSLFICQVLEDQTGLSNSPRRLRSLASAAVCWSAIAASTALLTTSSTSVGNFDC